MKSKFLLSLGAVSAFTFAASPISLAQAPGYHVIHRINTGGEGGWDYITVDTTSNRLFVSRGTHAMVIDLARDMPKDSREQLDTWLASQGEKNDKCSD